MNKYVLRTSLVWVVVLTAVVGIWEYEQRWARQTRTMDMPMSDGVQPVAAGPSPTAKEPAPSMPEQKIGAPLVPVQLTPGRMQSIGVESYW